MKFNKEILLMVGRLPNQIIMFNILPSTKDLRPLILNPTTVKARSQQDKPKISR
jgi:hypothetical protein